MEKKSAAVIVMDDSGKVLFINQGAMSGELIESTLTMIGTQLTPAPAPASP